MRRMRIHYVYSPAKVNEQCFRVYLLYISGMGIARDFKFSAHMDRQTCKPKNAKVGH